MGACQPQQKVLPGNQTILWDRLKRFSSGDLAPVIDCILPYCTMPWGCASSCKSPILT
jgi:hypothetical protein